MVQQALPEVDFDHYGFDQAQNPYPLYADMRGRCPIAHSANYGGFYIATTYDLVKNIYGDFRSFSSAEGTGIPKMAHQLIPIDMDPPLQTKFRRILNPHFTPEAVEAHRAALHARVNELIDGFIADGKADVIDDLVRPTLSSVVLPMLGIPLTDLAEVASLVDYMIRRRSDDPKGVEDKTGALVMYLAQRIEQRRGGARQDDLLQVLVEAEIDGAPIATEQIVSTLILVLFGGLDTTSSVTGLAILHLVDHPDDARALLEGDDDAWQSAIEEFVRLASPVQGQRRNTTKAIDIGDVTLPPATPIFALNASANRDAAQFPEPDRCMIARSPNEHMGFGHGAHICLGRNLARLELRVMLESMLRRLDDLAIEPDFAPTYTIGEARGPSSLRCTFRAGAPLRAAAIA